MEVARVEVGDTSFKAPVRGVKGEQRAIHVIKVTTVCVACVGRQSSGDRTTVSRR